MKPALLFLALVAASSAAQAAPCQRIEYVDARDWPIEKAEAAYCVASKRADLNRGLWRDLAAKGLLNGADSKEITADANSCAERASLFGRVIENVHKRPLPACK